MTTADFDPLDLVLLTAGFAESLDNANSTSLEHAENLHRVAVKLNDIFNGIDHTEWAGVWAYDVAEPLGAWLAQQPGFIAKPTEYIDECMGDVEAKTRELMADI